MGAVAADPSQTEHAYFFGYMGIASALVFANLGAAYGTAKSGVGICSTGVLNPDAIFKNVIPVVMAGILGIYGLIVAVIAKGNINATYKQNYALLGAGLCCGLSSLAAFSYWNCRRRRYQSFWSTRKNIYWYDSYPDLCRSLGSLRIHCSSYYR